MTPGPRRLIVTPFTPTLSTGSGLRTYGVAAALARSGPVEVAHVVFGAERATPALAALPGVTVRPLRASRGPRRALSYALARSRGVPGDLARGVSPELAGAARGAPEQAVVIADGPVAAAALLPLARRRPVVYLAHNLESGFRGTPALARFEREVLTRFAESWMATRADARGAVALAGDGIRVRYAPNVVDTGAIVPVVPAGSGTVLFVGDFRYAPNREALAWLTGEVLPRLWEVRADVRVRIAGRGLTSPPPDPRLEALGFVANLRSVYASVDAVAVPLLTGGGSPLKFVEALAYGLPVVATRHAAALLEEGRAGEHFLAAADAAEFADRLAAALADRARAVSIGAAGRDLVERCYSVDALAGLLAPETEVAPG